MIPEASLTKTEIPEREIESAHDAYEKMREEEFQEVSKEINPSQEIPELVISKTEFYQTPNATETVAIIRSSDGAVSIGLARAGRLDIENRQVTSEAGMEIAKGRAQKAMELKCSLIEKNYLRGIYASRIENV